LISLLSRSKGLVDHTFFQWEIGNVVKASRSSVLSQHPLELGELAAQHPGDHVELVVDVGGVGLGEDRSDGGRPANMRDSTALDCRSLIRVRALVQVQPRPPKRLLTSGNAGHCALTCQSNRTHPVWDEALRALPS
jgi:hypothetical protein